MKRLVFMFITLAIGFTLCSEAKTITLKEESTIIFDQAFRGKFVAEKQQEFIRKVNKLKPTEPIYIVLNTPGGSVSAGNLFIDTVSAYPNPVHTITIFAASMGYNTVQALGTRYILPSGELMSHKATIRGLGGTLKGSAERLLDFYVSIVDRLDVRAAKRVGISLEAYESLVAPDYWVTGEDAVKANHADEVVNVVCSKNMLGTREETVRTPFGTLRATFSKCPLILAPISVSTQNLDQERRFIEFIDNKKDRVGYEL